MVRWTVVILCLIPCFQGVGCREDCPPIPDIVVPTCPPQNVYVGFICRQDGMYLDDEKMVSTDAMHFVDSPCSSATFDIVGKGYRACCDDTCCEWHPDDPTYPLPAFVECETDDECAFGERCRLTKAPNGEQVGTCEYGSEGDPCDYQHFCEEGLFCNEAKLTCETRVDEEGVYCDGAAENCKLPLQCLCHGGGQGCRCYDGTEGDFCHLGTCQAGLYCAFQDDPAHDNACTAGNLGDPCSWDIQCLGNMTCEESADWPRCYQWLIIGEPCGVAAEAYSLCEKGLSCNTAFEPPLCATPGLDTDPCVADTNCSSTYHCIEELGKCYDGSPGDPCITGSDCSPGHNCIGWNQKCAGGAVGDFCEPGTCNEGAYCGPSLEAENEWVCLDGVPGDPCGAVSQCNEGLDCVATDTYSLCFSILDEWEVCLLDPLEVFALCDVGMTCNGALDPPKCKAPSVSGQVCLAAADCVDGLLCLEGLDLCTGGQENEPCAEDSHCLIGLACELESGLCLSGMEGLPCDGPEDCQEGLLCSTADGLCHNGFEGDPCAEPGDCNEQLLCSSADGQCHDGLDGDPCLVLDDCQEQLLCVAFDGLCHYGGEEDPCDEGSCLEGFVCVDNLCHLVE